MSRIWTGVRQQRLSDKPEHMKAGDRLEVTAETTGMPL
jgi:hypothetical protein